MVQVNQNVQDAVGIEAGVVRISVRTVVPVKYLNRDASDISHKSGEVKRNVEELRQDSPSLKQLIA